MSRKDDLDLRYLRALMLLNRSLGHELKNHLGNLGLQVNIISEILHRAQPGDLVAWEKIGLRAGKASQAFDVLQKTVERILAMTRPPERAEASLDLRDVIRSVEGLLAPHFKDEGKGLQVSLPDQPLTLEGSRDVIQRSLLVVLVAASLALKNEERLELRLDVDGILEIEGPPVHQWLPAVADIIEDISGGFEASPPGSVVAVRIPIQTSTR